MMYKRQLLCFFATGLLLVTPLRPSDDILTKDITGNHRVRLVAAHIVQARGQNLEAKFATIDGGDSVEFTIQFPAHSHTPHETTLMNMIRASIDWKTPEDPHEWHTAKMFPVFSIPREHRGRINRYERWWFVEFADPPRNPNDSTSQQKS